MTKTKATSSSSSSTKKQDPTCTLDRSLVNANTLPMMKDVGLSIFASACSKNRGAFVLNPSDGNTYGCLAFPTKLLDMVGIEVDEASINSNTSEPIFSVVTVEDLKKHYADGNLTASDTVDILDFLVKNTYQSTPSVNEEPYACDVSGVVTLTCDQGEREKVTPVRAVTMAGVFTPALWATGGEELTLKEATSFYTSKDFSKMKKLGLNTVQIPIPVKMFSKSHKEASDWLDLLKDILHQVKDADLDVIITLEQGTSPAEAVAAPVQAAALFAQDFNDHHGTVIVALVLPKLDSALLEAATTAVPDLNVWVPTKGGDLKRLSYFPSAAGVALDFGHTSTVADIASSSSQEDRAKLFYHENMACIARAPLEYSECYQHMPITVTAGFDLAIDNCHLEGIDTTNPTSTFRDYGQCGRFEETIDSNWWKDHRYSFATRQLYAYEKGMGWSFASWKLWETDSSDLGDLDIPAKLLAFEEVVAAGLIPSLFELDDPIEYPLNNYSSYVGLACLNPPAADFAMGDATFAPTPAPPPNCGNGWWNFETEVCDYWVPPTDAPTEPCPVCSDGTAVDCDYSIDSLGAMNPSALANTAAGSTHAVAAKAFFAGSMLTLVAAFFVYKVAGGNNKRQGYEQVSNGITV